MPRVMAVKKVPTSTCPASGAVTASSAWARVTRGDMDGGSTGGSEGRWIVGICMEWFRQAS